MRWRVVVAAALGGFVVGAASTGALAWLRGTLADGDRADRCSDAKVEAFTASADGRSSDALCARCRAEALCDGR